MESFYSRVLGFPGCPRPPRDKLAAARAMVCLLICWPIRFTQRREQRRVGTQRYSPQVPGRGGQLGGSDSGQLRRCRQAYSQRHSCAPAKGHARCAGGGARSKEEARGRQWKWWSGWNRVDVPETSGELPSLTAHRAAVCAVRAFRRSSRVKWNERDREREREKQRDVVGQEVCVSQISQRETVCVK